MQALVNARLGQAVNVVHPISDWATWSLFMPT